MTKHTFHIPVMGTGFTLDTPLKVAPLGMDSVISIVDDVLIENLRKMYCEKFELPYKEITAKMEDFRAKRITSYLNLLQDLSKKRFQEIRDSANHWGQEIQDYISMLPNGQDILDQIDEKYHISSSKDEIKKWLDQHIKMGSIDVNIMTKLDKVNYKDGEALPDKYNDAHAALRGFANSDLESSVIFSAGMNPRLYSYLEKFDDFFPDQNGAIKKKIILKVSDYRSALIQGKFLAKKGLWVSEFRIESGLNCGGHAFATDGFLMGPILEEFRINRNDLKNTMFDLLVKGLTHNEKIVPKTQPEMRITAQGGVGTGKEHQFLIDQYELDAVGWGSPFLLVPEATTVDEKSMEQLMKAEEEDLYLSNISPLGVPFNNLRGNTKDVEKEEKIKSGRPGSACPKAYLALTRTDDNRTVCTASRQFQRKEIEKLDKDQLSKEAYDQAYTKIVEKSCICVGLGEAVHQVNEIDKGRDPKGVSICPGPNMAYFSKIMSLRQITDHIYDRMDVLKRKYRPHVFVKELHLYLDYLKNQVEETKFEYNQRKEKYLLGFTQNLNNGLDYYNDLFNSAQDEIVGGKEAILKEIELSRRALSLLEQKIMNWAAKA